MNLAKFLTHWYQGGHLESDNKKLPALRLLWEDYPGARYSGPAYRLSEASWGEEPYLEAPTSWCKNRKACMWYLKSGSERVPDWTGLFVKARLSKAVDFSFLAELALPDASSSAQKRMLSEIVKAQEVVSLSDPQGVKILNWVEDKKLLPFEASVTGQVAAALREAAALLLT